MTHVVVSPSLGPGDVSMSNLMFSERITLAMVKLVAIGDSI